MSSLDVEVYFFNVTENGFYFDINFVSLCFFIEKTESIDIERCQIPINVPIILLVVMVTVCVFMSLRLLLLM